MTPRQVDTVRTLCGEVLDCCDAVRSTNNIKDVKTGNFSWYGGGHLPHYGGSSTTTAALRRRSMDLTRALAALRK